MNDWFRLEAEAAWHLGGPLIVLALALQLLAHALVPADRRGQLRWTRAFGVLFFVMVVLTWMVPTREDTAWIRVVAVGSLLMILARSVVVLLTETPLGRTFTPAMPRIVVDLLQAALYFAVGMLTLRAAGVDPSSLLTTSAMLTAALGFALQDTLGNVFSGLSLQLARPFDVGDWVELANDPRQAGRVLEISWRYTRLLTQHQVEIIVPNGVIAQGTIRNLSKPTPVARRMVPFTAAYRTAPDRVRSTVLLAIRGVRGVLASPAPDVVTLDFGADAVSYALRYFTTDHDDGIEIDSDVRDRIWHALKRAGIEIPFPQRDLHLIPHDPAAEAATARRLVEEALRHVPLLEVLPDAARVELAAAAELRSYGSGELVVAEGEPGDELFVVRDGGVTVEATGDGDAVVTVARLGPGEFFGEMSLLTGEVRTASVRADGGCELVVVGHRAMRALLVAHPELAERLSEVVVTRNEIRKAQVNSKLIVAPVTLQEESRQLLERIRAFFER